MASQYPLPSRKLGKQSPLEHPQGARHRLEEIMAAMTVCLMKMLCKPVWMPYDEDESEQY